jgi:hypothetical protein
MEGLNERDDGLLLCMHKMDNSWLAGAQAATSGLVTSR